MKLSQFKICWGIVRARYVKTAQKASLFGQIRHHFAVFPVLYNDESGFRYFVAVYGYLFRKLMILIGPGTKFSIKNCTAVYFFFYSFIIIIIKYVFQWLVLKHH
jgi:hypothetical protein